MRLDRGCGEVACVGTAVAARDEAELEDPGGAGQGDQQDTEDGCQQQGDAERQVAVRAEVADLHGVTVLQDEDQQQQENDGEAGDGGPDAADPGAPDPVVR